VPDAEQQPGGLNKDGRRYQFGVTVGVKNQVFWFEIAIDDASIVYVDEGLDGARRIETGRCVVERVPIHRIGTRTYLSVKLKTFELYAYR